MNTDEVIDLLTLHIAARDRRTVGKADVAVWVADVGDLAFDEAVEAVAAHFREQPDTWLMAGHVRKRVKAARAKRIEQAGTLAEHDALHGTDTGNEAAHRAALRRIHRQLGDGEQPPPFKAIEGDLASVRALATEPGKTTDYRKLREAWEAEQATKQAAEKAAREARLAEDDARREATREFTDASALLLILEPEAQNDARKRAQDELGDDATLEQVTIRAAQIADRSRVADVPVNRSVRESLARRGCPSGCAIGTHEPGCRYYAKERD
ncbi:hypothetical protein [Actinomadura bangladeshensis]|uniref:Uncharacterized protein n=1 Tax=Actinomadura bangladeshensis TaxID=453573 RepID=A0A6L9QBB6_9ACTN|nr:hypothetical protein [Actinomadura bangladeshensis]NEA21575.1 hypothetical protein [Actinomadura bangladeshensis]NEA22535.1 hypothetical protein [Actinomadura bangladeshensis]